MLREGVQALSDAESLLAVLLRTGTHKESAVTLAQRILEQAGGLKHIPEMSVAEMTKIKRHRPGQGRAAPRRASSLAEGWRAGQRRPAGIRRPRSAALVMEDSAIC